VKDDAPLPAFSLDELKGADVVVRANGFIYRGVLIGADETEIYLRGETRYVVLPLASVTDLKPERSGGHGLGFPVGMGPRDEKKVGE
jgi:hypothetical protein